MPKWMKKMKTGETRMVKTSNKRHFTTSQHNATNHRPPALDVGDPCPLCGGKLVFLFSDTRKRLVCRHCKAEWRP